MLRAHSHDPGAGTRPAPKAGRRAPPGEAAEHPAIAVGGAGPMGPIEWDGEDQILESGPAPLEGGFVPLQYLELVKMDGMPDVQPSPEPELGKTLGGRNRLGMQQSSMTASGKFDLDRPRVKFAGGGFVKQRPGREPSHDDYLELLRVAEVLDALNQVEGGVLQVPRRPLLLPPAAPAPALAARRHLILTNR